MTKASGMRSTRSVIGDAISIPALPTGVRRSSRNCPRSWVKPVIAAATGREPLLMAISIGATDCEAIAAPASTCKVSREPLSTIDVSRLPCKPPGRVPVRVWAAGLASRMRKVCASTTITASDDRSNNMR